MLQIFANNIELDIPVDVAISITVENPFMLEDRIPMPYSLSFQLPPTPRNLTAFDYPDRIGTYHQHSNMERSVDSTIRFSSINIASGRLILSKYDSGLHVNFSGIDFNDTMKKQMFTAELDRQDIPGTYTSVNFNQSGNYAYNYRQWAKAAVNGSDPRFVIAPIYRRNSVEPFQWARRSVRTGSDLGSLADIKRTIRNSFYNAFNPVSQDFYFTGAGNRYQHAEIFPQFRVSYLLEKFIGDKLLTNPFRDSDLNNLVVPSFYFPTFLYVTGWAPMISNVKKIGVGLPDGAPYINFNEFLPDVPASDFIKQILKLFCITLYATNGTYKLVPNTEILDRLPSLNWSDKLVGSLAPSYEAGKYYDYGYSQEQQAYTADTTPIIVDSVNDMINREAPLDESGEYQANFEIRETGQFFEKLAYKETYKIGNAMEEEIVYDYSFLGYAKPINPIDPTDQQKFNAKSDIVMPYLEPVVYFTSLDNNRGTKYFFTIPVHSGADTSFITRSNSFRERETSFELMLFDGMKSVANAPSGSPKYPYLSPQGNQALSLHWEGENGLLKRFHGPFKSWLEKDKLTVQAQILLNAVDLHKLDITEKVHVNGRNFFIKKIQYTVTRDVIAPALVDLVEA